MPLTRQRNYKPRRRKSLLFPRGCGQIFQASLSHPARPHFVGITSPGPMQKKKGNFGWNSRSSLIPRYRNSGISLERASQRLWSRFVWSPFIILLITSRVIVYLFDQTRQFASSATVATREQSRSSFLTANANVPFFLSK